MKKHILFSLIAVLVFAMPAIDAAAGPGRGKRDRPSIPAKWKRIKMSEAFRSAVIEGKVDKVKQLLDQGADINAQESNVGLTALMLAIMYNRLDVAKLLLAHPGIDIDLKNDGGRTALNLSRSMHRSVFEQLIQEKIEGASAVASS